MKEVTLRVAEHKLSTFLSFIRDLDYVEVLKNEADSKDTDAQQQSDDFFALIGMWEDRNISAEELRKEAWPVRK